jgi:methionine synthase / methylenetetrahydrofolate reductase(NADPH)
MPTSDTSSFDILADRPLAHGVGGSAGTLTLRERFRIRQRRRPVLLDGAMGTLLHSRGVPQRACLEELVLLRPEIVSAVHREYIEVGADAIETNSFGANRFRLAEYGIDESVVRLNRRAAQIARDARETSGRDVLIAGSVGPLGAAGRNPSRVHPGLARAAFREQIEGLLEGGVDMLMIETFDRLEPLLSAIEEAHRACDLPVLAQLSFGEDVTLDDGTSPEDAAAALAAAGVDSIGVNCGAGPLVCLEALVRTGPPAPTVARSIVPNAGLPKRQDGGFVYTAGPEYFAQMVPQMLAAGARVIGGCCGTTPAHIKAMRKALDALAPERPGAPVVAVPGPAEPSTPEADPAAAAAPRTPTAEVRDRDATAEATPPTELARKLVGPGFVVSVEIDPPRSIRIDRTIDAAKLLREAGADLVNISDSATGRVHMGAVAVAFGIQTTLGLECLVHLTTRDRNLMALEADLLGAHALGLRNILALTGDPPRVADRPGTSAVWDVDAIGLIEVIRRLNRGEDGAGNSIGQPAGFTIACALDPTASDDAREWSRLERKLAAGAEVILTQPLFSVAQVDAMLATARKRFGQDGFPVPVLLGVLPLHSARHAEFLHNEVPGITIPEDQRATMHAAGERGAEVGLDMAMNLLDQCASHVKGTYVMPSFGRYELAAELVTRIRAREAKRKPG